MILRCLVQRHVQQKPLQLLQGRRNSVAILRSIRPQSQLMEKQSRIPRSTAVAILSALLTLLIAGAPLQAQAYPSRVESTAPALTMSNNDDAIESGSLVKSTTVYTEDFSSDPGYTTSYSSNTEGEADVYWDDTQESYYAKVRDQSNEWWSVGKSPTFKSISSDEAFSVSFRFNPVEPDWGHYPGIYLIDSNSGENPRQYEYAFFFTINWSDHVNKKFRLTNGDGDKVRSPTIPAKNEWYEIEMTYDPGAEEIDLSILREDGSTFFTLQSIPFTINTKFDQILIGETGGGPSYGSQAQIRIDDITVDRKPNGTANGLVAHYPFDGDAKDASGNEHDGVVNGATLTADRFGNPESAYSFEASEGDNITVEDAPGLDPSNITISTWVKAETLGPVFHEIISKLDGSSSAAGQWQFVWHRKEWLYFYVDESRVFQTAKNPISTGTWHHLAVTYKSGTTEGAIYVDGQDVTIHANDQADVIEDTPIDMTIGQRADGRCECWDGALDDIRIYDRALSESEIQDLFTEGGWDGSGLVSRWPGEDNANDVVDGNSGTPRGNVSFASGVEGQAFQMDGSEDTGILVGDKSNLEGLEQLTVAAWVKTSNSSGNRSIVAKHFREDPPPSYILRTYHDDNSGRVSFGVKTGSSGRLLSNEIISSQTIADGQFHFVVGTYDGAEMRLYVDGETEASKSLSGTIQDSDYPVVIGNAGTAQGEIAPRPSFDGLIDDIRIYDRALSAAEVQALYGTQYIAGRILDSESNEGIEGAQVHLEQNPERATTTAADGSYRLYVAPGTGYTLDATAEGYFEGSRTYVDLFPSAPTTGIDIRLDPASSATPVVRALTPDPNPTPSTVEEGGTAYRHYRVIDRDTERALSGQTVTVASIDDDEVTYTVQSGPDGVVKVPIPSTDVGVAGAARYFEIVGVGGQTIPSEGRIQFTVQVVERLYGTTWALKDYNRLGVGIGAIAYKSANAWGERSGGITLRGQVSNWDSASKLLIKRRGRSGIGVSFGAEAPLNVDAGVAEVGAGAAVGSSRFFFGGDGYEFAYQEDPSSSVAAAQFVVWAESQEAILSSNLLALFTDLVTDAPQEVLDEKYAFDERGYGTRAYGEASFSAGIGETESLGIGVSAGVGGNFENYTSKRALSENQLDIVNTTRFEFGGGVSTGLKLFDTSSQSSNKPAGKQRRDQELGLTAKLGPVAGGNLAGQLGARSACYGYVPTEFGIYAGLELSGEVNYAGLSLDGGVHVGRDYTFGITPSAESIFIGKEASDLAGSLTSACSGSSSLQIGRSTYFWLYDDLFNRVSELQHAGKYSPVVYRDSLQIVEQSSGFEIGLSGHVGIRAEVGMRKGFLKTRSGLKERGVWLKGNHYPLETYPSIPEAPVTYRSIVKDILYGIDDAIYYQAIKIWDEAPFSDQLATKNGAKVAPIDYQIGDNGTTVTFSEGAIPSTVDTVWAASWGWWGKSVSTRPSTLGAEARKIRTATKQAAEEMYGMRYGIGGFYELQPADTGLEAPTTLTIHYSEQELDGVDESELAVYWEDVLNGRWRYLGGTVDAVNNTVSVQIDTLRTFTLAPRLPAQPFDLTSDVDALPADSNNTVTVTSATLINNDSTTVADGALYTVETDRGRIASPDADTTRPGVQIPALGGQLTFDLQAGTIPGTARVQARSVYGRSEGETTVTLQNVAPPPETQIASAQARDNAVRLRWNGVDESDLGGYRIYFGTDSTQYEGIAAGGQASPITAGEANKAVIEGLPNDSTFFFAVAPYDVAGAEADRSAAVAATPVDSVAPGKPLNLRPTLQADTLAVLAWTAPGDNGSEGLAYAYEVRYDGAPVGSDTSAWWDAATPADVTQPPSEAGTEESVPIRGGFTGEIYYGVRAIDEMGNASPIHITNTAELPVELAAFDATLDGRAVTLAWKTLSEENNAGFEVQRRIGAEKDFERIGYVEGAGTTTQSRSYQFEDAAVPFEVKEVTYRLKQVDYGGTSEYSPEVEVTIDAPDELALHGNYPNPFRERTTIRYELPRAGDVRIDVYNVLGQRVATLVDERMEAGREEMVFDARRLASGVYFVRLRAADETRVEKITVVR